MPTPYKDKTAELIAALRAIADPNKLDASRSPLPDNLARLALSWLAARPEFENARAVLKLYGSVSDTAELLNALRPFANIAADAALMADVLRGMRPHEADTLREALGTARLLVERHGSEIGEER